MKIKTTLKVAACTLALATGTNNLAQDNDLLGIVKTNFDAADVDSNGSLDAAEFPALINANAEHDIGRSKMVKRFGAYERAFNTADKDGDGQVAWAEIMANRPE